MHILERRNDERGMFLGKYYKNLETREKPSYYTAKVYVASNLPLHREGAQVILTMPDLGVEEDLMGEKNFYEGTVEISFTKNMASVVEALERGEMVLLDENALPTLEECYRRSEDVRVGDTEGGLIEKTLWKGMKKTEEYLSGEREMNAEEYFAKVHKNLILSNTNPNDQMPTIFDILNDEDTQAVLVPRVNAKWQAQEEYRKHLAKAEPMGPHKSMREKRVEKEAAEKQAKKERFEQKKMKLKEVFDKTLSFLKIR